MPKAKASEKARSTLLEAIRARFPQDNGLSDDALIAKHISPAKLQTLTEYYEKLEASHDRLDRELLNRA
jgi:hypothetical protein